MKKTASRRERRSTPPPAATPDPAPRVVGKLELARLDTVKPNSWNPNRMTEFQVSSTEQGLKRDGWLAAYALLIWRTDETGALRNIIIDGEHRWTIGKKLGFKKAPMAFVDGITEAQAREWTIALDAKRGQFDPSALRSALQWFGEDDPELAFRLGFDDDTFKSLLSTETSHPPEDFAEVTIDASTKYCCPSCGYEWNAASPAPKKKKANARA